MLLWCIPVHAELAYVVLAHELQDVLWQGSS
jgi:hypothetical protein